MSVATPPPSSNNEDRTPGDRDTPSNEGHSSRVDTVTDGPRRGKERERLSSTDSVPTQLDSNRHSKNDDSDNEARPNQTRSDEADDEIGSSSTDATIGSADVSTSSTNIRSHTPTVLAKRPRPRPGNDDVSDMYGEAEDSADPQASRPRRSGGNKARRIH